MVVKMLSLSSAQKHVETRPKKVHKPMENLKFITSVTLWERFTTNFLAFFLGVWIISKRFCRWLWTPNTFFQQQLRDNPPSCLVDTALGQHKYVKLKSGIKLHYVDCGSRTQPMVLLLHGFPDCWLSFRHQIALLSEHFRVIALDLKGFGDSDKPIWLNGYKIQTLVEELEQFVQALGVNNFVLIGHDIGGLIGWFMAYRNPGGIERFIAVSAPHPNTYWQLPSPCTAPVNLQWLSFVQLPYLAEMDAMREDIRFITDMHTHLNETSKADTQLLEAYKYSFSRKEDWIGPLNYYRKLPFNRICEHVKNRVPTLLITGNKDPIVRLESIVTSTEQCDKSYVKIIEGAGHFPHQEKPDVFNKYMLQFLRVWNKSNGGKVDGKEQLNGKSPTKGLMNRMFGAVEAVSTTMNKYGNSVIDSVLVQRRTINVDS